MIQLPSIQLPWHHTIIDLGTLGGPTSGFAINAVGTVTGFSYLSSSPLRATRRAADIAFRRRHCRKSTSPAATNRTPVAPLSVAT
jgi:hypothetical protein